MHIDIDLNSRDTCFEQMTTIRTALDEVARKHLPALDRFLKKIFGKRMELRNELSLAQTWDLVDEILATLPPKQQRVMSLRYCRLIQRSQASVGEELDLSQPAISVLETKAIRNLRHPSRSNRLRSFLVENEPPKPPPLHRRIHKPKVN